MVSNNSSSVVMVIQTFYPTIGGAEKQCLQVSKTLQERGVRVKVLTERWKGLLPYEEIEGIKVRRVGRGGPRLVHSIFFMLCTFSYLLFRCRRYRVIHVHLAASHAVAAAVAGKILNKKVLVKVGGGNIVGEIALSRKTVVGRLKLWALGFLKPQLIILNDDQRQELHGFGLDRIPVTLIPNGVDTDMYHPATAEEKNKLRLSLGWQGLVFLFVGRLSADKIKVSVLTDFLSAWSRVRNQDNDISIYLVGQGPLQGDYQNIIQRLGLQDSVHILAARNNVSALYKAADVFVLPSSTEGLSNALLEAMASNLPVLASRVPGIVEIIEENTHGFLFDPSSPNEIETALQKICSNREILQQLGANSRETALTYSIDRAVGQYLALYGKN